MKYGGFTRDHYDATNLLTIFISVGDDVLSGGTTIFYLINSETGEKEIVLTIAHCDGRWVYAPFSTVEHAGTPWLGRRGIFSAIVNINVYKFFELFSHQQRIKKFKLNSQGEFINNKNSATETEYVARDQSSAEALMSSRPPSIQVRMANERNEWDATKSRRKKK